MPANKKLLVLPGDGIGPEVMDQVVRVVEWFGDKRAVGFDVQEDLVGGAAYDKHGTPLTDATLAKAMDVDDELGTKYSARMNQDVTKAQFESFCKKACGTTQEQIYLE